MITAVLFCLLVSVLTYMMGKLIFEMNREYKKTHPQVRSIILYRIYVLTALILLLSMDLCRFFQE